MNDTLSKYYKYAVVGLFVYMPFHIFLSQWLSTFTGYLDVWKIGKDVFAWAILIFGSALVIYAKKANRLFWILWGLLLAYTAIHAILYITTDQPIRTGVLAMIYNTRLMWFVLIGYNLSLLVKDKAGLAKQFTKYLLVVSTIVCVVALLQWVLPKDIMTHFGYSVERGVKPAFFIDDKTDLPRVMSTVRDPNSLGAFLILPILLLLNLLIKNWKTDKKTLIGGVFMLHTLILFLTFSRGALLGMILAGGLYLGLTYKKQIIKYALAYKYAIIVAVLIFGLFTYAMRDQYVVQNVLLHSDENTKLEDSNSLHASLLKKGVDGIVDQPEGHGPGTAGLVAIHNKGILTENYFVQIGYEVGILGLIIFMSWLIYLLWLLRKNVIIISAMAGLILMNILFHTWANEAVTCTVFIIAGLLLYESKGKNSSKKA